MKKQMVTEEKICDIYNITGSLDVVIYWLENLRKEGWSDMDFSCDDGEIVFTRLREETDKEFEKRKKQSEKERIAKDKLRTQTEEQEFALYEKLKKKFEK